MEIKINPILLDLSKQLPDAIETMQLIKGFRSYRNIAIQARKELYCLGNLEGFMEDGQSMKSILQQNGYTTWLENYEEEDRLRLIGTLRLIAELSEELSEEKDS